MNNSPQPTTSSGLQTADAQITTLPSRLKHVILIANGTNAASLDVYAGTSTAGLLLARLSIPAGGTMQSLTFSEGGVEGNVALYTAGNGQGLFADVTGTGASYLVGYSPS